MTGKITHPIKQIVFDLGNVLVDVDYRGFTDAMAWDHDRFMTFFNSGFFREFEKGLHDETSFFKELGRHIDLQPGDEQRYRESIHRAFTLRIRTWATVHWLKKRYVVYLFSNTNSLDYDGIDRAIGIKRVIRHAYVSYAQGFIKPDPAAYRRFEELFHVDPDETLFVDDKKENVDAALRAGWHAETVDSENGLFAIFEHYHLL